MDKRYESELLLLPSYCSWAMHVVPVLKPRLSCARQQRLLAAAFCKKALQLGAIGAPRLQDAWHSWLGSQAITMTAMRFMHALQTLCTGSAQALHMQHCSPCGPLHQPLYSSPASNSQDPRAYPCEHAEVVATGTGEKGGLFSSPSQAHSIVQYSSVPVCLIHQGVARQRPGLGQIEGLTLLESGASIDSAGHFLKSSRSQAGTRCAAPPGGTCNAPSCPQCAHRRQAPRVPR